MKEINETQLRGWHPRRPAPGLKRRIFRAADASAVVWNWHQLASATACMLLAMLMFHFNAGGSLRGQKPVMTMVVSNGTGAANFSDCAQEAENHLAAITFDWTNHTGFKSSIGFTPPTNLSN